MNNQYEERLDMEEHDATEELNAYNRWRGQLHWANTMVRGARQADEQAGRTTSPLYITPDRLFDMQEIQSDGCTFCAAPLVYGEGVHRNQGNSATLERIDNRLGHTLDNVVLSCRKCNTIRGSAFTFSEMCTYGKIEQSRKRCITCNQTLE